MDYQIIRATREIGQIEVAYKHNGKVVGIYAIDVPVENGEFITGEPLEALIQHSAPVWIAERETAVAQAQNFGVIEAAVVPLAAQDLPTPPTSQEIEQAQALVKAEFEKKVAQALIKFGVLESDPTAIGVTTL